MSSPGSGCSKGIDIEGGEMKDIVERLREAGTPVETEPYLFIEAADEIERLRLKMRYELGQVAEELARLQSICGTARRDPGFAEIAGNLPRRSTEPPSPKT